MGAGLAPRQPAHQRGRDPARARRTTGTAPSPTDDSQFEHSLHEPEARRPREPALRRAAAGSCRRCAPARSTRRAAATSKAILLTGVARRFNLNFTGDTDADLLRLNTDDQARRERVRAREGRPARRAARRLGVLANPVADLCGYPNGRRLGDDIIDIDLRAVAQGYGAFLSRDVRPAGQEPERTRR